MLIVRSSCSQESEKSYLEVAEAHVLPGSPDIRDIPCCSQKVGPNNLKPHPPPRKQLLATCFHSLLQRWEGEQERDRGARRHYAFSYVHLHSVPNRSGSCETSKVMLGWELCALCLHPASLPWDDLGSGEDGTGSQGREKAQLSFWGFLLPPQSSPSPGRWSERKRSWREQNLVAVYRVPSIVSFSFSSINVDCLFVLS